MCRNPVKLLEQALCQGFLKHVQCSVNFLLLKTARFEISKIPISYRCTWLVKPICKIIRAPPQYLTEVDHARGYAVGWHHTPGRLNAAFNALEISSDGAGALTIPGPTSFDPDSFLRTSLERSRNRGRSTGAEDFSSTFFPGGRPRLGAMVSPGGINARFGLGCTVCITCWRGS